MKRILFTVLAVAFSATQSQSAILYSGHKNIIISNTFTSIYIDIDNFAASGSATPQSGWDVNTFFGGEAFGNSTRFQPVRQTAANNSAIINLTIGTLVNPSLTYFNGPAGSETHIGASPGQFTSGTNGFIGFKLIDNSTAGPYYGWMRVNFSNTGATGAIIDWAYDNTGAAITVGTVPEPTALALFALAGSLISFRRKR